jgi:hypothetical protein
VYEAGAGHRFDHCADVVTVAGHARHKRPECVGIRADGSHLDGPTVLIENVHVHAMAGQVQSGVQHLPGLLAVVDQQPNVATNEVPLHGIHTAEEAAGGSNSRDAPLAFMFEWGLLC